MPATGYGINVPITPQTDPRKQPDYVFRPYPKMMLQVVDKDYQAAFREKHSYWDNGRQCYSQAAPKLNTKGPMLATEDDVNLGFAAAVGDPVIVPDKRSEQLFLSSRGLGEGDVEGEPTTIEVSVDREEPSLSALVRRPAPAPEAPVKAAAKPKAKPGRPKKNASVPAAGRRRLGQSSDTAELQD